MTGKRPQSTVRTSSVSARHTIFLSGSKMLLLALSHSTGSTYPKDSQEHFGDSKAFLHRPIIPKHSCSLTPQQLSQECEGATETPPSSWGGAEGPAYQKRDMPPSVDTQKDCNAWTKSAGKCARFDLYFGGQEASSIAWRIWRGRQVSQ